MQSLARIPPSRYAIGVNAKDASIAKRLGIQVRKRRVSLGWSQATLAERIETSVEYVSMLERGARLPSVPTLVDLAKSLETTADTLLGELSARSADDALVVHARAVPTPYRAIVTRMLAAVAEPPSAPYGAAAPRRSRTNG